MRRTLTLIAGIALLAACGSDSSGTATTAGSTAQPTTTVVSTTLPATTAPTTAPTTTAAPATTEPTSTEFAIWPAADVVFTTPEAAATDFLANVFGDGPVLGEFAAGDSRSGEFEVFATADGTIVGPARSTLLMRQLGPSDGWFVLAAASEVATVTTPAAMSTVPAAPLTVEGVGTGFEATIILNAFLAGHADTEFDHEVTMAGNFGETLPYSVTLDLSAASPGDVVVIMVRGGTGLETDPGDFGAIAVVVG